MIGWLRRLITGRGIGPSRNRAHAREVRMDQEIEALMDAWHVAKKRGEALVQLERFRAMAAGGDGGHVREGYTESVRKMHYPKWKDDDFGELVRRLDEAIAVAELRDAAAEAMLREVESDVEKH